MSAKISLSEYIQKLRSCLKEVIDNFIISSDNGAFISFFISAKPLTKFFLKLLFISWRDMDEEKDVYLKMKTSL